MKQSFNQDNGDNPIVEVIYKVHTYYRKTDKPSVMLIYNTYLIHTFRQSKEIMEEDKRLGRGEV